MKQLRKKAGMTQRELARRVRVSQVYISRLENGDIKGLSIEKLLKISKVLNVCPCLLFIALAKITCDKSCLNACEQNFFKELCHHNGMMLD